MGTQYSTIIESGSKGERKAEELHPSSADISLSSATSSIMGKQAPPLYEAALIGNWEGILVRIKMHPEEILYEDKCRNMPLHLCCRRQPPTSVLEAILQASEQLNVDLVHRTTVDGLTPLHFACYCGADAEIVKLLLGVHGDVTSAVASTSFNSSRDLLANETPTSPGKLKSSPVRTYKMEMYLRNKSSHNLDRRGRTPLHCACAGFRTPLRPAVIHTLLKDDPVSATLREERGRTPFSLMYDDYAEDIQEVLCRGVDADTVRDMCWKEGGELVECWQILVLLLKAAYLGYVEDTLEDALMVEEVQVMMKQQGKVNKSSNFQEEKKKDLDQSYGSAKSSVSGNMDSPSTAAGFDFTQSHFQLLHAAAASLYILPHGFFQFLLKVCGNDRIKEHDADFHLPLHLATKALPPASISNQQVNPNRYSISTSFHGQSTLVYEEKLGVILTYYPDKKKAQKNKQYTTTSFQPSEFKVAHQTPIISHLLDIYPDAASTPDDQGKYPILLAIESGKSYEFVIEPLLEAFPAIMGNTSSIGLSGFKSEEDGNAFAQDPGDFNSNTGMDVIQASLMHALTNPSIRIRNETCTTIGSFMKRIHKMTIKDGQNENRVNPKSYKVDEFVRGIIRTSVRYGSVSARHGQPNSPESSKNDLGNGEFTGLQSTMLQALSAAMTNISPNLVQVPDTPQLALDVASNMLKHEDLTVRESAALCIGASLELLGEEVLLNVITRTVLPQRRKSDVLSTSNHSIGSISSFHSLLSRDSGGNDSVRSISVREKERHEQKINSDNQKLVQVESSHIRHGRALACFRILTSGNGEFVTVNDGVFKEVTSLMQALMMDEESMVREAACLAMGAVLGQCCDTPVILKSVRQTILKCMRTSEDICVQIALARGLMVATRMKPHAFICKQGTPILEGALMLAVSSVSPTNVQKMYHGFLWLALGIGDKESAHYGLTEYMSSAEGENPKIMMSLVTKTLAKIESVHDILWSSSVLICGDEEKGNDEL